MESFVWIGFAAFFVASLTVGVRLVALWLRTRELPELLIGIGVLGIGPVGFGIATVAELARTGQPGLARIAMAVAMLAISAGVFAKYLFNWRVYHPQRASLGFVPFAAALLLTGCFALDVASGLDSPFRSGPSYLVRTGLQIGCLLWGSAEALLYWRKMRRRLQLGLADAVVTNRFFLWGLGAGAAGVGSLVGVIGQLATGRLPIDVPWLMMSSSLHGLTAAVAMWLAFVPTAGYRRFIRSHAPAIPEAWPEPGRAEIVD